MALVQAQLVLDQRKCCLAGLGEQCWTFGGCVSYDQTRLWWFGRDALKLSFDLTGSQWCSRLPVKEDRETGASSSESLAFEAPGPGGLAPEAEECLPVFVALQSLIVRLPLRWDEKVSLFITDTLEAWE